MTLTRCPDTKSDKNSWLAPYAGVEHTCLDLAVALDLNKQPVVAGFRKSVRERKFLRKRVHFTVVHGNSQVLFNDHQ